jgi:hypothetical protein
MMSALIIPLFWSILVPATPTGLLLQKTQSSTIGLCVILEVPDVVPALP